MRTKTPKYESEDRHKLQTKEAQSQDYEQMDFKEYLNTDSSVWKYRGPNYQQTKYKHTDYESWETGFQL
jgi:hypothetical protein